MDNNELIDEIWELLESDKLDEAVAKAMPYKINFYAYALLMKCLNWQPSEGEVEHRGECLYRDFLMKLIKETSNPFDKLAVMRYATEVFGTVILKPEGIAELGYKLKLDFLELLKEVYYDQQKGFFERLPYPDLDVDEEETKKLAQVFDNQAETIKHFYPPNS